MTYQPASVLPGAAPATAIEARLVLPLAAGFLGWIIVKLVQGEPASQRWSLAGLAAADIIVMGYARFVPRSAFFQTPRESA